MFLSFRTLILPLALALTAAAAAADSPPPPDFGPSGHAFLEQYCIKCHSGEKPKADLSLDPPHDYASFLQKRKTWESILDMVETGEMPPENKPQPAPDEAEAFSALVKNIFSHADKHAKPDPGRVTMRRLNRLEYRNSIRDLVGIDFDTSIDFPSDDIGHGFDNIGDVLSLSPLLMERYLAAAGTIMAQAIMPNPPEVIKRHLASPYTEPASADSAKLVVDGFRPMRTDGTQPIELGPLHTTYKFVPEGEYLFRTRVYADKPLKVTILVHGNDLPDPSPEAALANLSGNPLLPARILQSFDVKATSRDKAETLEVRVPPIANRQRILIAIDKPAPGQPHSTLWVEFFALDGPLDPRPASHHKLLATTPDKPQVEQSREVMARFLRRAYRRTPDEAEIARSLNLVKSALDSGQKWEEAIQLAMQAALCSPKFLFRVELDANPQSPEIRDLDEFQLASRLSYFLWCSTPDDTLLDLAEKRQLNANLDSQITRLLADPRASSLVDNFAMQWLQLQRIDFISPDGKLFPSFDQKLRESMVRETQLFVGSIIKENRSIIDLVDADYTFLNEPLANHYGIADTHGTWHGQQPTKPGGSPIKGDAFQRVSLPDRTRGGLITQASVLTVTSNPTRTSPVKRGRWLLEQILGNPPPPAPPNVPELPSEEKDVSAASLRVRLEAHRRDPACANCHAKMDPIGFALENFNAVGAFRTKDGNFDIDPSGELPDGTQFSGPVGLKTLVRERKDEFVRCLTERLLIYALGRGLEFYDRPAIDKILQSLPAQDHKFSALVTAIIKSDPFRQRRGL